MDDLISRQAAIAAVIKRDANCGIDSVEVLRALPSAQSEIIRCKDCKYWDSFPSCSAFSDLHICKYWMGRISTMEGDFCSRAERREDG